MADPRIYIASLASIVALTGNNTATTVALSNQTSGGIEY